MPYTPAAYNRTPDTHSTMAGPTKSQQYSLLMGIFALTAFVLMWIGSLNCNFIKFTSNDGPLEPITMEFGIWSYRSWSLVTSVSGSFILESCHVYPESIEPDSSWIAARTFSGIAFVCALFMVLAACGSLCLRSKTLTHGWEAPFYSLACISQGFTLLILNSNACHDNVLVKTQDEMLGSLLTFPNCDLGTGAKLTISSTVFFFAAAVSAFIAHKAEKQEMEEEGSDELREPLNDQSSYAPTGSELFP